MIKRHDVAHRPDAQPLGARAGADRVQARRRHPALVGTEMMLDAERMIEAELVAQGELAPELFVALVRRHAGLGPDMGKMREFHGVTMIISYKCPDERGAGGLPPSSLFAHRSIQKRNLEEAPPEP